MNDFGLKIRIFDISKIKISEKIILLKIAHVTLKYHLLQYSNTVSCLAVDVNLYFENQNESSKCRKNYVDKLKRRMKFVYKVALSESEKVGGTKTTMT